MSDLSVKYLGLSLRNPYIASSSGLTESLPRIVALADAGIGAVVLKSLFEEQLINQALATTNSYDYPEARDYIHGYVQSHAIESYIKLVSDAKREVKIPIIPSINCASKGQWVEFASKLEQAGADALELNVHVLPSSVSETASSIERQYFEIVQSVTEMVRIPVAVKLTRNLTNPLNVMQQLQFRGVKGIVLFNRYYEPDIDLTTLTPSMAPIFSSESEFYPTLRWLALARPQMKDLDLAISSGVHSGTEAAKALAAGSNAVQVCSVLYLHGVHYLKTLIEELEAAIHTTPRATVKALQGAASATSSENTTLFERSQFMKYFSNHKE